MFQFSCFQIEGAEVILLVLCCPATHERQLRILEFYNVQFFFTVAVCLNFKSFIHITKKRIFKVRGPIHGHNPGFLGHCFRISDLQVRKGAEK